MSNPTNPFSNSVQFTAVAYPDQLAQLAPPTVQVQSSFFPLSSDIVSHGLTIELWFKAVSSGALISVPMTSFPEGAPPLPLAPLIYIDSNGLLRAGLFDTTLVILNSPPQNLITTTGPNNLIVVGPINALASPLSVIDGQWHHAALVVQPPVSPSTNGSQSLYLDGRLAATGTGNGSYGLTLNVNDSTWIMPFDEPVLFGGPVTPQLLTPPIPNYQPYAQGFCGCLNELRTWNTPRTVTEIQQLMAQPLGSDLSNYQGLVGYVGSTQLAQLAQPGNYLSLVPDAPPVDPFTDVDRIPGYQNYGIYTAIPFTTVAPQVTFQPAQTYSTKISLCQADQLQVSFPTTNAQGDNLSETDTFTMIVTGGASGQISNISQIGPGQFFTITAPQQDCYRLDFSYTATTPVTLDNLQFMLIPGPLNTLMQLLLDVIPLQAAYSDPNYPITPTTVSDPRNPNQTVTLPPYWPLFTDQTVFPIDPTRFSSNDLLSMYLNFNDAAKTISLTSGATFSDFFALYSEKASIDTVEDLKTLLAGAYQQITGAAPPDVVPVAPFQTSVDQIYAYIYNVNEMRETLSNFLSTYQGWANVALSDLALAGIPGSIANQIYNGQESVTIKGPSAGDFIANLILGSAIVGLGAVAPMAIPVVEGVAVSAGAVVAGIVGGAGANAMSETFGALLGSSSVSLVEVNYTTLEEVSLKVSGDIGNAYTAILTNLLDQTYVQTLYSNYGLLQAVSFINPQPLSDVDQNILKSGSNSLMIGTTYASWKALIPSVFTWTPQLLENQNLNSSNNHVFMVSGGVSPFSLPYQEVPSELGVQTVLHNDLWKAFYWMLSQIQDWQTGTNTPAGQFFTICPIFYFGSTDFGDFEYTADWVIAWSLRDTNNNMISSALVKSLFGLGNPDIQLSFVDPNNPLAAAGYGWYCRIANGAVTTPFDAFMNWGEGVPGYSPQILVAQLPDNGTLYNAVANVPEPLIDVTFAAAAAADMPPSALVTLEPSTLTIKGNTVGQTFTIPVTLTNNQQNSLQNITTNISGSTAFTITGVPTEVQPGQSAQMSISFTSEVANVLLSATLTLTAPGQYNPISLTMELSGIVSPSS